MRRTGLITAAVIMLYLTHAPAFADISFSDSTFNLGDYTTTPQPPFSSDGIASLVFSQCICNGANALQAFGTFNSASPELVGGTLINNSFTYNPGTQGIINSIDAEVDKNIFTDLPGQGFGNTFRITLRQGTTFYEDPIPGTPFNGPSTAGTTGFLTISGIGLLSSNFIEFDPLTGVTDPTLHPDFNGPTMLFGLTQLSGTTGVGTITALYDNLNIDVHTGAVTPVSEPGTLGLMAGSLFMVGLLRRRYSKNP
jgi:hypothetical protein